MEDYIIGIGKRIREIRKEKGLTINTVASSAEVSNGLISRVENGRTIPSLPVLLNIIAALDTEVASFFNSLPQGGKTAFIVSRKEEHAIIEKEDDAKSEIEWLKENINGIDPQVFEVEPKYRYSPE